jgi:fatty-acyl-CoA synthase
MRVVVVWFAIPSTTVCTISVAKFGDLDTKFAREAWLRALGKTAGIAEQGLTLPLLMDRLCAEFDAAPALIGTEAAMSYRQLGSRCNQYARWGIAHGIAPGDAVALIMQNCTEYLAVWLGLTRIGAVVALVNSQLAGDALAHSVNIVNPKALIVCAELAPRLDAIRARLPRDLLCRVFGDCQQDFAPLAAEVDAQSTAPLSGAERVAPCIDHIALYIYTSGTTGLPKAAKVSHYRLMQWSHWFSGMLDIQPQDRMFNCLPLYHSIGGVVATFAPLVSGAAVVIRRRFSASDFWRDIRAERCTLFQYIGELCRYLVNSPHQEMESEHSLRLVCGNGLRPEVWEPFKQRFKIPRIVEYYAATEGNFSLYNCEGQPGAIGRIPPFLASRLPVALLQFDLEKSQPRRNAQGHCERCAVDEVGEAVGFMPEGEQRAGQFEGYADPVSSAAKVLHNVFKPGDSWYRTGDLMRRDERGFYYFVDRIGETFRWKGENVSTTEVLSALSVSRGVIDGVVYGVALPGNDGRAGMAALIVNEDFDLDAFRADVATRLPAYARPVFLRLLGSLDATGTFKPRKQDLMKAGIDPSLISDPLYVDDVRSQRYVPLEATLFAAISSGARRL